MQSTVLSQFPTWHTPLNGFSSTGRRHVYETSMSIEEMAFYQKRSAESDIRNLILQCRERYWFAHMLIRPHAVLPKCLFDRDMPDLGDFLLPWSKFCSTYRAFLFDSQMCLFEDQRTREIRRWHAFVEKECLSRFSWDPSWVRTVLETANLIPGRTPNRGIALDDLLDDIIQDVRERNEHAKDDDA